MAKIENRISAPPVKRSRKFRMFPWPKRLWSLTVLIPAIGMWAPTRKRTIIPSVKRILLRRSLILKNPETILGFFFLLFPSGRPGYLGALKAALGQPPVERRLAAFEADAFGAARAALL